MDKVRKNKEPGFQERMHELVKELVVLPKYSGIIVKDIKEVSCAPDNREGNVYLTNGPLFSMLYTPIGESLFTVLPH